MERKIKLRNRIIKTILCTLVIGCLTTGGIATGIALTQPVSVQAATIGQKNAVKQAKHYLQTMPFSKKGLVEQLEYEGYSSKEAKYGVKYCKANWKKQAAKKAKSYLSQMSFSKKSLSEQLEYEGFTSKQIKYAIKKVGY